MAWVASHCCLAYRASTAQPVMPGLELSDNLDPSAIATLALAAVTFVALLTIRWSLTQTQEEIELSRREVEEAQRPIVLPVADSVGSSSARRPYAPAGGRLVVPVENVGSGPALGLEASVGLLDDYGEPLDDAGRQRPATAAALGKDRSMLLEIRAPGAGATPSFELTLTYFDVAGRRWVTVGRWIHERGRYERLELDARA